MREFLVSEVPLHTGIMFGTEPTVGPARFLVPKWTRYFVFDCKIGVENRSSTPNR